MIIQEYDSKYYSIGEWPRSDFMAMSSFPTYAKWKDNILLFRATAAAFDHIMEHWPDAQWTGPPAIAFERHKKVQLMAKAATEDKAKDLAELEKADGFEYITEPYDHQRKAFLLSRGRNMYALLMEQGTGKSKVIIDTARFLFGEGKIDAVVVIAPNGVHENWARNEIPKHGVRESKATWVYSAKMNKMIQKEFDRVMGEKPLKWFLFNVEGFTSQKSKTKLEQILATHRCLLVIDESSRIKNYRALRTKYLCKIANRAPYRRILSGTPVTKGLEDLFSQFNFLSQNIIGLDTFTSFKRRYCVVKPIGLGEMIVGYRNEEELVEKIDGYSFRVRKIDCLDLPEKIYKKFPVHLSIEQKRIYRDLVDECRAEFADGKSITAELAIVKLIRLQQVICGWLPFDGESAKGNVVQIDGDNPRIVALRTILEDVEGKVIIWARFVADLNLIAETLGEKAIRYRGDIADVERFQAEGEGPTYFVANPASAGLGLTLTRAETVVYYSNDFNLENRLQSEDRCHRIGTVNPVTYYDIEAIGTVDTKIIRALRNKKLISNAILQDPEDFFLEYEE